MDSSWEYIVAVKQWKLNSLMLSICLHSAILKSLNVSHFQSLTFLEILFYFLNLHSWFEHDSWLLSLYILIRLFMYLFINLFHAAISSKKYINTTRQKLNKGLRKYLKTGPLLKGHSYKEVTEKKLDYARLFLLILDFYCCYLKKVFCWRNGEKIYTWEGVQ